MPVFSTPARTFPAPAYANSRHSIFAAVPKEPYAVGPSEFGVLAIEDGGFCNFMESPVVVGPDGQSVISDYSSNYHGLIRFHPHRLADCSAKARYIDGTVIAIADDVQVANIYHWISDWLPRLAFLGPRIREVYVATAGITSGFQRETLRLCGVEADRIIPLGNFEAVRAREMLVPSNLREIVHPGFTAAPWVLSYLRGTLGLGALREATTAGDAGDRLYISRADAQGRRVVNEAELMSCLEQSGYRRIVLSELPLVEQIATVARAKRVIGLHGAGLTHFAFSAAGSRLLEILPSSYGMLSFYIYAGGLGADYLTYVADRIVPGIDPSFDDVEIDVADFAARCRGFYA
jgi:capsular polysaccharide biosynthesis protein